SLDDRGRFWATHGTPTTAIGVYDGYEVRTIPAPGNLAGVFPGNGAGAGACWSVPPAGLFRREDGKWVRHPVPAFDRTLEPSQYPDPIAVPEGHGRVLLVTPDFLLGYTAETRQMTVLRTAAESSTGRFIHAVRARDGAVWVTTV